jgi:hypothetical protein
MKANELRIGNFIYFNNNIEPKRLIKVTARFFTALAAGRPHYELVPDEELNGYHQPIQLTPSILENCGFVTPEMCQDTVMFKDGVMLDLHRGKILLRDNGRVELMYLHQLQNLYFAMTGTELEIDLNKLK